MVIVTAFENKLNSAFRAEGLITLQQQLFCFHCREFYTFEHNDKPENCLKCGATLDTGEFARPDIVIVWMRTTFDRLLDSAPVFNYAVVRVDGRDLHRKNRKHIMYDHHQFTKFREADIPVFIVYNDELDDSDPWVWTAMARYFFECMKNPEMYKRYLAQKSIIERTKRPF